MNLGVGRLKESLRDSLPKSWQIPVKYHYDHFRSFVEPELKILGMLVEPGDIAIDVGANRGTYTYYLWKLGCRVKLFEPNRSCFASLKGWARGKKSIDVYDCALSSRDGNARLFVPIDPTGLRHDSSGSLKPFTRGAFLEQTTTLRTMDSFQFVNVEMIKIDVEGHEIDVIEGALETIKSFHPALLIEIEQRHVDRNINSIFRQITALGYAGFFLKTGKLRGIECFDPDIDQISGYSKNNMYEYINNFLFLATAKIDAGRYDALFNKFELARP